MGPATIVFGEVDGLPPAVARAPVRGTIARLLFDADGLTATLADGSTSSSAWLLTWEGNRWRARPGDRAGSMPPGWVVAIVTDPAPRSPRPAPAASAALWPLIISAQIHILAA